MLVQNRFRMPSRVCAFLAACLFGCASPTPPADEGEAAASHALEAFEQHPGMSALPASASVPIASQDGTFQYKLVSSETLPLHVSLPHEGPPTVELTSAHGTLRVALQKQGASAMGFVIGSRVLYPDALGTGLHVLHQPAITDGMPGDEEAILLSAAPKEAVIRYRLDLPPGNSAVLRNNRVDIRDSHGAPSFNLKRPFIIESTGRRREVRLALSAKLDAVRTSSQSSQAFELRVEIPDDIAYPALLDPEWGLTGSLLTSRLSHTSTLLDDGRVLVVGGQTWDSATQSLKPTASVEVYDPVARAWSVTTSIPTARYGHGAILLADGTVLVAGGTSALGVQETAFIYNPTAETWTQTGSLSAPRTGAPDFVPAPS